MTLIDKIKSYVELWQMILPHVPAPEPVQLNMWLVMYPERIVEAGIQRASQKYREALFPDPDPQMVYRYGEAGSDGTKNGDGHILCNVTNGCGPARPVRRRRPSGTSQVVRPNTRSTTGQRGNC